MKYPIISYRDKKVGFSPPQCEQSETAAIRGFAYAINSRDGMMNFAPNDYELYKIGSFDTDTGLIVPESIPVLLVSGSSVFGGAYAAEK